MILYLVLSHKVATKSEVVYYIYRFETGDGSILTLVDMEKTTFSNRFYTHVVLHFFIRSSMFSEYMGDWHTWWSMVRSHKHVCVCVSVNLLKRSTTCIFDPWAMVFGLYSLELWELIREEFVFSSFNSNMNLLLRTNLLFLLFCLYICISVFCPTACGGTWLLMNHHLSSMFCKSVLWVHSLHGQWSWRGGHSISFLFKEATSDMRY